MSAVTSSCARVYSPEHAWVRLSELPACLVVVGHVLKRSTNERRVLTGALVTRLAWLCLATDLVCKQSALRLSFVPMSQPDGQLDPRAANRARFELELEFVQSLANPFYLHSLAQQGILSQPTFINFLEYLQYWKEKEYARFIL